MPQGPIVSQMFAQSGNKISTPLIFGVPENYVLTNLGESFVGANQTGVTTTVGLATTYVGLCLSNPNLSTVNLVIGRVTASVNVAFGALTAYGLAVGANATDVTHTTPVTPRNAKVGVATPAAQGLLDSSATLPAAPTYVSWLAESPVATNGLNFSVDFKGGLILPPGGYAIITSTAAGPTSGFFGSFQWFETPLSPS